ncbi:MAG: hypothetical protein HKO06_05580, partial [Pseudomonadales bacterium]|nr:hypothetical protein [Pseudomonadales bacterium]
TTGTLFGGAVYVYGYDALGDSWDEEQVLYSPENPAIYMFGNSDPGGVALTCDHVAVSESINRKVYIFNTTNYSIEAELSEPGTSFYYGKSIDLFGDKLVVSDPYHDTGRGGQGVVYYYHRVGANNWQLVATFAPPDNLGFIEFGANVHISDGNRLFIVAPQVDAVYYVDLDDYPVPVTLPLLTPLGYAALSVMLMAIGLGTLRSKRK